MANDDVKLKIKVDDQASSKIADIANSTEEMASDAQKSGEKFSFSFTEINQAIELVQKALSAVTRTAEKFFELGKAGAFDIELLNASYRNFGKNVDVVNELQRATNSILSGTEYLQHANTLSRYGANLEQVAGIMRLTKVGATEMNRSFDSVFGTVVSSLASGRITGLKQAFGDVVFEIEENIKAYEKLNGKLSQTEKQQKILQGLLESSKTIIDEETVSIVSQVDKYDQLTAAYGDVKAAISNFVDRIIEAANKSDVLVSGLRSVEKAILAIDSKPIETLAKWLNEAIKHASHIPGFIESFFVDESDKINDALKSLGINREAELKKWRDDVAKHGREYFGFSSKKEEEEAFKEFERSLESRGQLELDRQRYWSKQMQMQDKSIANQNLENLKKETLNRDKITGTKKDTKGGGLKALSDMQASREIEFREMLFKVNRDIDKEEIDYQLQLAVEKERIQSEHNERMIKKQQDAAKEQLKINQQFGSIIAGLGTSSLQNMSFMLGELAAGAEFSANAMVANLLDLLGTFAIQVGTLALAMGPVFSALFSLNPAAAVATGIVLLAVGAALKGYAAQLKQSAAGAAGGAIGTGDGAGGRSFGERTQTPLAPTQEDEGGSVVYNITINGVVGDRKSVVREMINGINSIAGKSAPRLAAGVVG